MKGVLITRDGRMEKIQRPAHQDTLRWLYEQIGCRTVDAITLGDSRHGFSLWVDDEGMLISNAEANLTATAICATFGAIRQLLYGTAVLLGGVDDDGDTLGLPDSVIDGIISRYNVSQEAGSGQ